MTAPIDIECPACKSTPGNYCTIPMDDSKFRQRLTFHHAERVDAAFRATIKRRDDPQALRVTLREALDRLAKHQLLGDNGDDLSFILTTREVFGL